MTLFKGSQGKRRAVEKHQKLLKFLREECWTHVEVVRELLGFERVQAAYKILWKFEKEGFVKRHKVTFMGDVIVTIWGITYHGIGMSWDDDEEAYDVRAFEQSKVSKSTMEHHLNVQYLKVKCTNNGWTNWVNDRTLRKEKGPNPDAIACSPLGLRVAFEFEKTVKSPRRYSTIIVNHLKARKEGYFDEIWYIMPDERFRKSVEKTFRGIKVASHNGSKFSVTEKTLEPFKFIVLNDLDQMGGVGNGQGTSERDSQSSVPKDEGEFEIQGNASKTERFSQEKIRGAESMA